MLSAITEKKPFVLGTRYGPGVEMDKDVYLKLRFIFDFSGLCIVVSSPPAHGCWLAL